MKSELNRNQTVYGSFIGRKTIFTVLCHRRLLECRRKFKIENCNRFSIFVFGRRIDQSCAPRVTKGFQEGMGGMKCFAVFPSPWRPSVAILNTGKTLGTSLRKEAGKSAENLTVLGSLSLSPVRYGRRNRLSNDELKQCTKEVVARVGMLELFVFFFQKTYYFICWLLFSFVDLQPTEILFLLVQGGGGVGVGRMVERGRIPITRREFAYDQNNP